LDAISSSLSPKIRAELTSCLGSHFLAERQKNIKLKDVVGVVGIKRGSPWLAIELANRLRFGIALHRGEARANANNPRDCDYFDGDLPERGKVVLVDDSITGGTMVMEAIDRLKALHIEVDSCLVLFEVLGKHGRENLAAKGVQLLAICTYDGQSNTLAKVT
jgi:orotate phosphoribosyltransferase